MHSTPFNIGYRKVEPAKIYRSVGIMTPSPFPLINGDTLQVTYDLTFGNAPNQPKPNCRNCGARYHPIACDYCETPS